MSLLLPHSRAQPHGGGAITTPTLWVRKPSPGWLGAPQGLPTASSFPSSSLPGSDFPVPTGSPLLEDWLQGPVLRRNPPPVRAPGRPCQVPGFEGHLYPKSRSCASAHLPPPFQRGESSPLTLDAHTCPFPSVVPQKLQVLLAPLPPHVTIHQRELLKSNREPQHPQTNPLGTPYCSQIELQMPPCGLGDPAGGALSLP